MIKAGTPAAVHSLISSYIRRCTASSSHYFTQWNHRPYSNGPKPKSGSESGSGPVITTMRLSKILASSLRHVSRRCAERSIRAGEVQIGDQVVFRNDYVDVNDFVADDSSRAVLLYMGKEVSIDAQKLIRDNHVHRSNSSLVSDDEASSTTKVWAVNKLAGELVTHHDPLGRPTLLDRLKRGGGSLTKFKNNLKSIGRLDFNTEGLILITTCGKFARDLELPANAVHRKYRVRVHGLITEQKLSGLRSGVEIEGIRYKGMDVRIESKSNRKQRNGSRTNTWLQIKCIEGKNRQIRKCLEYFGLNVTRLVRIAFGDYILHSIPPGMAIEVPIKPLENHKNRGKIESRPSKRKDKLRSKLVNEARAAPVQWINHLTRT